MLLLPRLSCKRRFWLLAAIALPILSFLWGPTLFHLVHRMGTSNSEKQTMRERYQHLSQIKHHEKDPTEHQEQRDIYLWFHIRGWNIDEGWHENFATERLRQWSELCEYWE
ncbi:hypothetical protein SAMN02745181_2098 [Rubritalea squalenifaciens DSM 18772]|uniref:Uncharacterized protein n=1 Tax=Rubritalea squalenifaciens DSM 18772 TaxID=1123071 RepID=A0A1M6JEL4_9BACT|nr:hypothetical protein [Rubritalea squalenifaciens]SHJ45084.1 hypothetical protein SAMN02745181_2098 [Rubritalea squalenifaciens DSM 18772]